MNRKPATAKPVSKPDYGLPRTFAEAKAQGWTFKIHGETRDLRPLDKVDISCTSPDGMKSKYFPNVLFGDTFVRREPKKVLHQSRGPGKTLAEQAQHRAEVAARNRALCMSTRTGSGNSSQPSSGKKGKKGKKK